MPIIFKKEEELLLFLLKSDAKALYDLRDLNISERNWEALYQLSSQHSLSPLLYYFLKNAFSNNDVPSNVLRNLHNTYISNSARNIYIYHRLSNLIKILNENNISFILLKGAHLCKLVYKNIGLRTMADIDILFNKKDLKNAQEVINQSSLLDINDKIQLDYHWYLEQFLNIDTKGVWLRAQNADIEGQQALILSPEDLIIHLCIHFAFHHNFQIASLRSLYDIKITIDHYYEDINWNVIFSRSREWKVRNSVYISLLLAKTLMDANVSHNILDKLQTPTFNSEKLEWAVYQIFNKSSFNLSLSPYFWQLFKPGLSLNRITSFFKILFPSPEFISQKYNTVNGTFHNYLYYFVRFKNKILIYLRAIYLILRKNDQIQMEMNNQIKNIEMRGWLSSE